MREPTKSDAGVATEGAGNAQTSPTLPEILAKTLPVGLVTAYTAFIAVVTEVVVEPTSEDPNPDQYLWMRWIAFAILVLTAAVVTFVSYRTKVGQEPAIAEPRTVPWPEIGAVTVAAAAWGLGIPESPILAAMEDQAMGVIVLALIAFLGVAINLALSTLLKKQA